MHYYTNTRHREALKDKIMTTNRERPVINDLEIKDDSRFIACPLPAFSRLVGRHVSVAIRTITLCRIVHSSRRGTGCIAHASSGLYRLSPGMRALLLSVCVPGRDDIIKFVKDRRHGARIRLQCHYRTSYSLKRKDDC